MRKGTCTVDDCNRGAFSLGWCQRHYVRWRNHGSLEPRNGAREATETLFVLKVDRVGECWIWTGAKLKTGYGALRVDRKTVRAHRWSYEHFRGPIPSGLHLDHLCGTRLCVNPGHLEAVTQAENNRRAARVRIRRSSGSGD